MYVYKSFYLSLLLAGAVVPVLADEHRHHGAHEHGVGTLNIAQEGSGLQIELESPAVNIVGFEHAPNSEEEHEALESALKKLKDGVAFFVLSEEAGCRLVSADVETPLAGHDDHDHDEEDHHDHEGEEHEHESAHADIDAAWQFTCEHPEMLNGVNVHLFDAFPKTQRLNVQYITEKQQGAASLDASHREVRF